jgi:hypothetical protein
MSGVRLGIAPHPDLPPQAGEGETYGCCRYLTTVTGCAASSMTRVVVEPRMTLPSRP